MNIQKNHTPTIKAVRIDASLEVTEERKQEILDANRRLIDEAKALQVDYLLFDAKVKGVPGGSGKTFDIAGLPPDDDIGMPYFLAGGIGLSNVAELIQLRRPFAIDVSSAVETDGYKDKDNFLYELYTKPTASSSSGETVYNKTGSFRVFENNVQVEYVNKVNEIQNMVEQKSLESKGMTK